MQIDRNKNRLSQNARFWQKYKKKKTEKNSIAVMQGGPFRWEKVRTTNFTTSKTKKNIKKFGDDHNIEKMASRSSEIRRSDPGPCGTPLTWIVAICKEKVKRN